MKKFFVLFTSLCLLVMACAKEEVESALPEQPSQPGGDAREEYYQFTLTAGVDSELTKTSYADDKTFSWTPGDQISVLFHNGEVNKFFTLTTSGSGASATFSGSVETGYELGSSNSEKIALFPAGEHSYDRTKAKYDAENYPKRGAFFNIPSLTDFTKTHFSANLPMAALGDGENNFTFKHIAGTYKVVFTDIDPSVKKVKLHVKNQLTRALSGDLRLEDGGSHNYVWWWVSASEGSMEQTVSYVVNVVEGSATFYVPYTNNDAEGFKPIFTLTNADNGYTLKSVKAKAAFSGDLKPSYDHIVRIVIPASGTGTAPAWKSNHGINWDMVETQAAGRVGSPYDGINLMKVTADATNLYVFLDIKSSSDYLLDNASYDWSNYAVLYAGDGSDSGSLHWGWSTKYQNRIEGWLKTDNTLKYTVGTGAIVDAIAVTSGDHTYYEIAYPRTGNSALLGTSAYLSFTFDKRYRIGETVYNDPTVGSTCVGYAPTTEASPRPPMLRVDLPAFVSPSTPAAVNLTFTEATGEVLNPERGMMSYNKFNLTGAGPYTEQAIPLDYTGESLAFILFYMEYFIDKDLDSDVINLIKAELGRVRAANKKVVLRFAYSEVYTANTPQEAAPSQILEHIDQMADAGIFSDYADVIYVVQAGWLGTYGEWYYTTNTHGNSVPSYTDYYAYTVSGSTVTDFNDNHKALLDKALLKIPAPIQIGLRGSFYKRYYLSPSNINSWDAITSWGTGANSRLAFFNDGFRGDNTDVGTFNSDTDRTMWYSQGNWLACGGELSYKNDKDFELVSGELKNCDNAIAELKRQHWSYLHYSTSNLFMKAWYDAGRFEDIKKALGYRLVLNSADFSFAGLTSGSSVSYSISIENTGCAPVVYPRPFKLVLIHGGSPVVLVDNLGDVRDIAPGASATVLDSSFTLPQDVTVGDKLAIWLSDNAAGLQSKAAYSIRLANSDITWDGGYNILHTF